MWTSWPFLEALRTCGNSERDGVSRLSCCWDEILRPPGLAHSLRGLDLLALPGSIEIGDNEGGPLVGKGWQLTELGMGSDRVFTLFQKVAVDLVASPGGLEELRDWRRDWHLSPVMLHVL